MVLLRLSSLGFICQTIKKVCDILELREFYCVNHPQFFFILKVRIDVQVKARVEFKIKATKLYFRVK